MNCTNCKTEVDLNYCPKCGQPTKLKRIDGHYILHEIEHVLHFERGILYTIKELIVNPGQNVKSYLVENRSRLVKPVIFIIITSLIYAIAYKIFHFEDAYINFNGTEDVSKMPVSIAVFKWLQSNYGYTNMLVSVFMVFWLKLFFRKANYNFFEILILLCFVLGIGMLIYAFFGIAEGLTGIKTMKVGGIVGLIYSTWAIGDFFGGKKITKYLKAFASYVLGMLTFILIVMLATVIIDTVILK
ncbi:DUF3667 domain-containing protein [Sphingobacterium psychroaquaticum]|uniref:DUF3667 domain-containing protein n=1 Tax=Sphingobacterium psychroaquaticum TaxID=561061 RepID=UPI00106D808A|nr:DUF3667 domain-containing protein [Sphingobacterium psychroaquaticum]QBQ41582.1 DUF3667 domain-containing protein [Sphingobacterium psychroaquaticum]